MTEAHTRLDTEGWLEKQRGITVMTWRLRIQGLVFAVVVLGAIVLAVGDRWVEAPTLGLW